MVSKIVKKIKKTSSLENPSVLLLGIPGPGLIGTITTTYIIHALKMDLVGEIVNSPTTIVFVDNGQIMGPVRIYKKDNLFAVLSDIHVPERNISNLKTYGLVTHEKLKKILYDNEIPKFLSGVISGPDATILAQLKNSHMPTIAFNTECNYFFPDPDAAMQTIKIIAQITKKNIDLTEFKKQMDYLRLQNRQLMEDTLNVLQAQQESSTTPPQIYK